MAGDTTEADLGHRLVAWERVDESAGQSMAQRGRLACGWRCHSTEVLAGPREVLSCWFQVDVDEDWVTREVVVGAVADGGRRTLTLSPTISDAGRSTVGTIPTWTAASTST
jgi:hypothetical protein